MIDDFQIKCENNMVNNIGNEKIVDQSDLDVIMSKPLRIDHNTEVKKFITNLT